MIRKLFTLTLCLIISSCGGFSVGAGLKFKKKVDAKTHAGNPGFTGDGVALDISTGVVFERPIGKCGANVTFFGILLPVIPVWMAFNSCEKEFVISSSSKEIVGLKLKYNGIIHDIIITEKWEKKHGDQVYMDGKKFKFKIDNFWKFRMADDKAIIVIVKTNDGKEFTKELPVKWGLMTYYHWSFP